MTKTQRNKIINKQVYRFAEKLGYEVDMTEIDVTFIPESGKMDDIIEYRRSSHSVAALFWACPKTSNDEKLIEQYIDELIAMDDEQLLAEHQGA